MNQIDESRPGAGREIERTWQRLRAQDAGPREPEIDREDAGISGMEDEANDSEQMVENDDLVQPEMLDDPLADDGDLAPYDDRVPTEEPEYGDHRDTRIRQDDEAVDSTLADASGTPI